MDLTHSFEVTLPVDETWAIMTDVNQVAACLPGASITQSDGDSFAGEVKLKIGPINVEYAGEGRFTARDRSASRAVLEAGGRETRGKGGASAVVTLQLSPTTSGTQVDVVTDLSISGRLAQFGRGVIADVADRLLGQFVANLQAQVVGDRVSGQSASGRDPKTVSDSQPHGPKPEVIDYSTREWPDDLVVTVAATERDEVGAARSDQQPVAAQATTADAQMLRLVLVPIAKRAAPLVGGGLVIALLVHFWRRRGR